MPCRTMMTNIRCFILLPGLDILFIFPSKTVVINSIDSVEGLCVVSAFSPTSHQYVDSTFGLSALAVNLYRGKFPKSYFRLLRRFRDVALSYCTLTASYYNRWSTQKADCNYRAFWVNFHFEKNMGHSFLYNIFFRIVPDEFGEQRRCILCSKYIALLYWLIYQALSLVFFRYIYSYSDFQNFGVGTLKNCIF